MEKAIKVSDLYKSFNCKSVLHGISFEVRKGECFCLLGPNGAGKTTTLKILTSLIFADSGSVTVMGCDVSAYPQKLKGKINIIPQSPALDPFLTVRENLLFYGMLQKMSNKKLCDQIDELIGVFEIKAIKNQITFHCSGGEIRRLLVARAFLKPGELIFMDEPTAGIDILLKNRLWDYFNNRKHEGITIFLNTHDLNEAEVLSDRIAFLLNGRIVAIDTPENLKRLVAGIKISIEFENAVNDDMINNNLSLVGCEMICKRRNIIELMAKNINSNILQNLGEWLKNSRIKSFMIHEPSLNDVFKKLGVSDAGDNLA